MGFWTVGPVAGSLITSIVATQTLSHFVDWQSQFIISGLSAIGVFIIALFFMKDLSSRVRDQLMVSMRDQTLVEARARGLSETEVFAATEHPWRQIAKWDLAGSSFGIAMFLLVYYVAAGGDVHELYYNNSKWADEDITALARAMPSPQFPNGALSAMVIPGTQKLRVYYLGINNVFGLIGAFGAQGLADERVLLAAFRQFLSRAAELGSALPGKLLESPTLRCKANLLTRLHGLDELVGPVDTQSVYVTITNPLRH